MNEIEIQSLFDGFVININGEEFYFASDESDMSGLVDVFNQVGLDATYVEYE
jgi:hypothetical protein